MPTILGCNAMAELDILFINPGDRKQIYQDLGDEFSGIEPPVFAGLFATYVRRQGLSCAILDAPALGLSADQVAERIEEADPTLVAIVVYGLQPSASTQNMTAAANIAAMVKARNPERKILMTGTHPAALPERTLRESEVDFVVDLEGPVTITQTAMALKQRVKNFSQIGSLWWKDGNRLVQSTSTEPLLQNLDEQMPGIAWDMLDMSRYRSHNWHSFAHLRTPPSIRAWAARTSVVSVASTRRSAVPPIAGGARRWSSEKSIYWWSATASRISSSWTRCSS